MKLVKLWRLPVTFLALRTFQFQILKKNGQSQMKCTSSYAETYLGPFQTLMMEPFCKSSERLLAANIFFP